MDSALAYGCCRTDPKHGAAYRCHQQALKPGAALRPLAHVRFGDRMNKDQIKGQAKQAKGEVKELAGKLVGDKAMETKGMVQKTAGKIQSTYGNAKGKVKKGR